MNLGALALLAFLAPPPPPTVAVSYFDNNTGQAELAPLAKGLADMLITDLAGVPGIQIVEREKLNQALAELALSRSAYIDPASAQKLGRGLAASHLLTGGYTVAGDSMRIDARVFRVDTGIVVASERVEGRKDEFFKLESRLVAFLGRTLQVTIGSADAKPPAGRTRSFDAWAQYSSGLDAQDRGDAARARAMFEQALRTDPAYQAARNAHERLAAVFARQDRTTVATADQAFAGLTPDDPDLPAKVSELLATLDDTKSDQLARKLQLLTWLGERKLLVCGQPVQGRSTVRAGGVAVATRAASHCSQAHEVLGIAYRLMADPSQWEVIPRVCENFILQLPEDRSVSQYCEGLLQSIANKRRFGEKSARKDWNADLKYNSRLAPGDWRRALADNDKAMRAMVALYAGGAPTSPSPKR